MSFLNKQSSKKQPIDRSFAVPADITLPKTFKRRIGWVNVKVEFIT